MHFKFGLFSFYFKSLSKVVYLLSDTNYNSNFHVYFFCVLSITMSGLQGLAQENIWFDKSRYDNAERCFYEGSNGVPQTSQVLTTRDQDAVAKQFQQHNLRV